MHLYTEEHVVQVFVMGILNGLLAAMLIKKVKNDFIFFKRIMNISFRQYKHRMRKQKVSAKIKIPTDANSEYLVH